jgi:hypothetical protein
MHVLDTDALTWTQISAEGQAPISRSRHTATLVGKNLLVFGGVGGGRPLNDLFVLHTESGTTGQVESHAYALSRALLLCPRVQGASIASPPCA